VTVYIFMYAYIGYQKAIKKYSRYLFLSRLFHTRYYFTRRFPYSGAPPPPRAYNTGAARIPHLFVYVSRVKNNCSTEPYALLYIYKMNNNNNNKRKHNTRFDVARRRFRSSSPSPTRRITRARKNNNKKFAQLTADRFALYPAARYSVKRRALFRVFSSFNTFLRVTAAVITNVVVDPGRRVRGAPTMIDHGSRTNDVTRTNCIH